MLNSTCFKSDTIRCKIHGAMREAITKNYPIYIDNRKGQTFLRIERVQGRTQGRIFRFIDKQGHNVTESAYKGLAA